MVSVIEELLEIIRKSVCVRERGREREREYSEKRLQRENEKRPQKYEKKHASV
jgi:hypothetical protein